MCLQCLTNAIMLKREILPGYHLMKAMKDAEGWKKDQFGLIRQNDPDFVWDNPGPEPCAGMPDEEINNCPKEKWDRQTEWLKKVEQVEKNFISDPMTCYEFVATCMAVGYDPKKDGFNIILWFVHYCAEKIEKLKICPFCVGRTGMVSSTCEDCLGTGILKGTLKWRKASLQKKKHVKQ